MRHCYSKDCKKCQFHKHLISINKQSYLKNPSQKSMRRTVNAVAQRVFCTFILFNHFIFQNDKNTLTDRYRGIHRKHSEISGFKILTEQYPVNFSTRHVLCQYFRLFSHRSHLWPFGKKLLFTPGWKMFLTVGFCGGFTTFSTFANENLALIRNGDFFHFIIYTGLSVFLGIMATFFGVLLTKIL